MIVNSRKCHHLAQQQAQGQSFMAQVRAVGDAPLIALGSDPKRPWADVNFVRTFRQHLKRQRTLDANGVKSETVYE